MSNAFRLKLGNTTLTWTYRGELSTYKQGATTYRYSYDTQGNRTNQRVYQSNSLQSQVFTPNDLLTIETTTGQTPVTRLNLTVNNLPITTISTSLNTPSTTEHLYTNHLASVTKTRGSTTTNTTYSPFGASTSSGTLDTNRGYIGEDLDSTGLSYLNARYYNSDIGRFVSQDPVSRDNPEQLISNPQALNMYAYGNNSPISTSDRSGLFGVGWAAYLAFTPRELYDDSAEFKQQPIYSSSNEKFLAENYDKTVNMVVGSVNPVSGESKIVIAGYDKANIVKNAAGLKTSKGYTNVIVHGDTDDFFIKTGQGGTGFVEFSHRTLARYIEKSGNAGGKNINLLSCNAGACADGSAQNLANKLGKNVRAANGNIKLQNGNASVEATRFTGTKKAGWKVFKPGNK